MTLRMTLMTTNSRSRLKQGEGEALFLFLLQYATIIIKNIERELRWR